MKLRIALVACASAVVAAVLWLNIRPASGVDGSVTGSSTPDAPAHAPDASESAAAPELHASAPARESIPVQDSSASEPPSATRPSAPETSAVDTTPPALRGKLVDEEGRSIVGPGSWIALRDENGRNVEPSSFASGAYEFRALEPGRWRIDADAAGFEPTHREFARPAGEVTTELDVVLHRRPTVVVVLRTPKQEPFESAKIAALPALYATRESLESAARPARELRNECGRFHERGVVGLAPPYLGLLELTCEMPVWASLVAGDVVLASKRVETDTTELAFELDPDAYARMFANVRLRAVDATSGQPVGLAVASLRFGEDQVGSGVADEAGVIQMQGVRAGRGSMTLERDGYAALTREFEAQAGKDVDLGDVKLQPIARGVLALTVTRPPGVESITVAWSEWTDATPMSWSETTWRDGDTVNVPLDSGHWLVWAHATSGGKRFSSHDLEVEIRGGVVPETLELEPLVAVVLRPAESDRTVAILDPGARAANRRTYVVGGAPRSIEIAPGDYEFFVSGPGISEQRMDVSVGPTGTTVQLP